MLQNWNDMDENNGIELREIVFKKERKKERDRANEGKKKSANCIGIVVVSFCYTMRHIQMSTNWFVFNSAELNLKRMIFQFHF